MNSLSVRAARRLALAQAGLLKPDWTGLPRRASGRGRRARRAAQQVIRHFGYLQLDTVAVAGARSHAIVLMSRLEGFDPELAEDLLQPDEPLFEYWGHEASWLPIELYPLFDFRRRAFRHHPWWGDVVGQHPDVADALVRRIRDHGPLRSADMEGRGSSGWWDLKLSKRVATALWSSGDLAIRERRGFQRAYDLTERVVPDQWRSQSRTEAESLEQLVMLALQGHGWATTNTIVQTWRLSRHRKNLEAALGRLVADGRVSACTVVADDGTSTTGWVRPTDLELAARLETCRPRRDVGVLLSPFDPLLWDRNRVQQLFGFHQVLEIFKPAPKRIYGYYCLPVLAGENLVARFDLKADRRRGILEVVSRHHQGSDPSRPATPTDDAAGRTALERFATALGLEVAQ